MNPDIIILEPGEAARALWDSHIDLCDDVEVRSFPGGPFTIRAITAAGLRWVLAQHDRLARREADARLAA